MPQDLALSPSPQLDHDLEFSRLRRFFFNTREGILFIRRGIITDANPGITTLLGWPPEALVGRELSAFVVGPELEEFLSQGTNATPTLCVTRLRRSDGEIVHVEVARVSHGEEWAQDILSFWDITPSDRADDPPQGMRHIFELAFSQAPSGLALVSPQGIFLQVNRGFCAMLGYAQTELVGRPAPDFTHPEDLPLQWQLAGELLEGRRQFFNVEKRYLHKRGHSVWTEVHIALVRDPRGAPLYFVVHVHDATERRNHRETLQNVNRELQELVTRLSFRSSVAQQLSELSEMLQVCRDWNEAFLVIASKMQHLLPGVETALYRIQTATRAELVTLGSAENSGRDIILVEECWALRRQRVHLVANVRDDLPCNHARHLASGFHLCVPIGSDSSTAGLIFISGPQALPAANGPDSMDVESLGFLAKGLTERVSMAFSLLSARATLVSQAVRDPLTHLYNRRYLEETLEREAARVRRQISSLGLIMLDLDHFKHINDSYGHGAGDAVLKRVGELLVQMVRQEDIACRFGGEEFVLVLPDADLKVTTERAEAIRRAVEELAPVVSGRPISDLTCSMGVAVYPLHGNNIFRVLELADEALLLAKRSGRNLYRVASEETPLSLIPTP